MFDKQTKAFPESSDEDEYDYKGGFGDYIVPN